MKRLPILAVVFVLDASVVADDEPRHEPLRWRSKGMTVFKHQNLVKLQNGVEVVQGRTKITAHSAEIFFHRQTETVQRIVLQGGVEIVFVPKTGEQKITAQGNHLVFLPDKSITLRGNARLTRGEDTIKGKVIIYDLRAGWMQVTEAEGVLRSIK